MIKTDKPNCICPFSLPGRNRISPGWGREQGGGAAFGGEGHRGLGEVRLAPGPHFIKGGERKWSLPCPLSVYLFFCPLCALIVDSAPSGVGALPHTASKVGE